MPGLTGPEVETLMLKALLGGEDTLDGFEARYQPEAPCAYLPAPAVSPLTM